MDWTVLYAVQAATGLPMPVVYSVVGMLSDASAHFSCEGADRMLGLANGTARVVVEAVQSLGVLPKSAGKPVKMTRSEAARAAANARWGNPANPDDDANAIACDYASHALHQTHPTHNLPPCIPPLKEKGIRINTPPSPSERPPVGAVHHSDQPDLLTASPAEPAPKPKRPPSSSQRFTAPTVDEVAEYCRERGNAVDADQWHAHYTANGWRVGKNPMRDWRAAVRTWERNAHGTPKPQTRDGPPMPRTYRECQDAERRQTAEDWLRRRGLMDDGEQAGDLGRAPGAATALRVIDADFRTQG